MSWKLPDGWILKIDVKALKTKNEDFYRGSGRDNFLEQVDEQLEKK